MLIIEERGPLESAPLQTQTKLMVRHDGTEGAGEIMLVARGEEHAGAIVLDDLRRSATTARDDGETVREALHDHLTEGLWPGGGVHEHIMSPELGSDVLEVTDEVDLELELASRTPEFVHVLLPPHDSLARDGHTQRVSGQIGQVTERGEKRVDPFPLHEPTEGEQADRLVQIVDFTHGS